MQYFFNDKNFTSLHLFYKDTKYQFSFNAAVLCSFDVTTTYDAETITKQCYISITIS